MEPWKSEGVLPHNAEVKSRTLCADYYSEIYHLILLWHSSGSSVRVVSDAVETVYRQALAAPIQSAAAANACSGIMATVICNIFNKTTPLDLITHALNGRCLLWPHAAAA